MAGLTDTGFQIKTLSEIRTTIANNLRDSVSADIDTSPTSRVGQFVDIVSNELFSAWEALEATYNSFYPDTASGTSLDNVSAITNTVRKAETSAQAQLYFSGVIDTVVPVGAVFEKTGTGRTFSIPTTESVISGNALLLLANGIAASGTIILNIDPSYEVVINWDDTPSEIESAILAEIPLVTDVEVRGQFNVSGAVHIFFRAHTLPDTEPTLSDNVLTSSSGSLLTVTANFSNEESALTLATLPGYLTAPIRSIATIVSTVTGLNQVINIDEGAVGTDRETDAQLRERRSEELQKVGTSTVGGIKEAVSLIPEVTNVSIIENDTSSTDADGRPPHSFEIFVTGGDDDVIAQTIYNSKPLGIGVVTTVDPEAVRVGNITDVNGLADTLAFSSPDPVPMQVVVNITINAILFPTDGIQQIKDSIVAYFATLELGDDVLNHMLYSPVNTIPGILTLTILQTTVAAGTPAATNTPIDPTEVAQITAGNVIVNIS